MGNKIMKKVLYLILLSSLLFLACLEDPSPEDLGNFFAFDFKLDKDYRVDADLLAVRQYCNVWVEKGSGLTNSQIQELADQYNNHIHEQMIAAFGINNISYAGRSFSDVMKFADFLGNNDGKLCILLLDIQDNYQKGVNNSYIAGYFWSGDFIKNMPGSNGRDMIYIDTYPGMENPKEAYNTLAHELQHLMNYVTSVAIRNNRSMDLWINEGLAAAAEWIYSGQSQSRINWYNNDPTGLIAKGNNFFSWNNRANDHLNANMDNYATVFIFFQWLRLQPGSNIYRKIISSTHTDYRSVVGALDTYSDWDTVLKTWFAANYINAADGPYGYKNDDPLLMSIKAPVPSSIESSVRLAPGEGVYSKTDSAPNVSGTTAFIKYSYLNKETAQVRDNLFYQGGALLTYNANPNRTGAIEQGVTTGIPAATANVNIVSMDYSLSLKSSLFSGAYRIDAGDFLRASGSKRDPYNKECNR